MNYNRLFTPIRIGTVTVPNRFVQPAIDSQTTTEEHLFSEQSIAYFAERARGGFGLQIAGYMAVSPDGIGVPTEPGLWDDHFIEEHRKLTERIHAEGGLVFAQLHHSGMMVKSKDTGLPVKGPSAMPAKGTMDRVYAMTTEECYAMADAFGEAARRAKEAGFDGVEVHGAHFYLLGQFMSRYCNKRTDEFGGDYEGRFRLPRLCIEKVKAFCGPDYPVTFRISAEEFLEGGSTLQDAVIYARMAEEAGADAINVSTGSGIGGNIAAPSYKNPGFNIPSAALIKKNVSVPVIAVGRINDPALAAQTVEEGSADLIALGRQSVTDPQFPAKLREGRTDEILRCAGCLQRCWYGKGCDESDTGISCILNPFSGKEGRWKITPAQEPRKVLVVGGGVAGLSCAWVAARRGHKVTLCEKQQETGGNFRLAAVPPFKNDFAAAIRTYETLCRKNGVEILRGEEVTEETLQKAGADVIVLATGAKPLVPPIKGLQDAEIHFAGEILSGEYVVGGKKVLIMGGGLVGCELAEYLNQFDNHVDIVEMQPMLAKEDVKKNRAVLMQRLTDAGTGQYVDTKITEILPDGILAERNGEEVRMDGYDVLILALGYRNYNPLEEIARSTGAQVEVIGDAARARNAKFAVYEGVKAGLSL